MNYYDLPKERRDQLDGDLVNCMDYNPLDFKVEDIHQVLATFEGENDGEDWAWVVSLKDGRFAYVRGGCDYTGWD